MERSLAAARVSVNNHAITCLWPCAKSLQPVTLHAKRSCLNQIVYVYTLGCRESQNGKRCWCLKLELAIGAFRAWSKVQSLAVQVLNSYSELENFKSAQSIQQIPPAVNHNNHLQVATVDIRPRSLAQKAP